MNQPMNLQFASPALPWKKTGKKKYEIWFCMPGPGIKVHNKLEGSDYVTDEKKAVVLSGTVGEQWTVTPLKLAQTYTFANGEPINNDSFTRHMKHTQDGWMKAATIPGMICNYALKLDIKKYKNVPISTSWGEILLANRPGVPHGEGDYLVCSMYPDGSPNFNDMWVVNGEIFPGTYNMQGFEATAKTKSLAAKTAPRPAKLTR